MRPVKAAIVGGGWFGNFHLANLLKMEGVEVVAVATTNPKRLADLSRKAPSARAYPNHVALIEQEPQLDAIVACVPPDSHRGLEEMVAEHHLNLYIEKPLGVSLEEVRRHERTIRDSGIICAVGYQTRYNSRIDEMKEYLSAQKVGVVVAKWVGVMPDTPWWRIKARSGGQLAEQVTHMIDILRYLFGDIRAVYSTGRSGLITGVPDYDIEDCSASIFTFESGLLATVTCGCFLEGSKVDSEIRFEIYAEEGKAEYSWDTTATWGNKERTSVARFGNEFHYPALQAFIEAVRTDDPSKIRSPYSDAVKTFAATFAANLSMDNHREVLMESLE